MEVPVFGPDKSIHWSTSPEFVVQSYWASDSSFASSLASSSLHACTGSLSTSLGVGSSFGPGGAVASAAGGSRDVGGLTTGGGSGTDKNFHIRDNRTGRNGTFSEQQQRQLWTIKSAEGTSINT